MIEIGLLHVTITLAEEMVIKEEIKLLPDYQFITMLRRKV